VAWIICLALSLTAVWTVAFNVGDNLESSGSATGEEKDRTLVFQIFDTMLSSKTSLIIILPPCK
jgi:hypothetical protein